MPSLVEIGGATVPTVGAATRAQADTADPATARAELAEHVAAARSPDGWNGLDVAADFGRRDTSAFDVNAASALVLSSLTAVRADGRALPGRPAVIGEFAMGDRVLDAATVRSPFAAAKWPEGFLVCAVMMEIKVRPAKARGGADHGWLKTFHTFSFADYFDRAHMGFRALRVINEDFIAPGKGFGTHGHRDMEIITYVLEGAVGHRDSMGNGSTIVPGEVQRMSAGTGVTHSEMNASKTGETHMLQIWILPDRAGHQPGYEQKAFPVAERTNKLRVVASPDGRDGSVTIHQDATLSAAVLTKGAKVGHALADGRHAWVQVARGNVVLNGTALGPSDGAAVSGGGGELAIEATSDAEVLVFDLA